MPRLTKKHLEETRLKKSDHRYTTKGMLQDAFYNLMHLERRRFFYTTKDLTLRPAQSIQMLLNGYRGYLYPFFSYLILIGTITIFLSVRYKFFVSGFELGDNGPTVIENLLAYMHADKEFRLAFFEYAEEFATLVTIVALPVFTLFTYLLFGSSKYNLAEHFIINVYIGAQQMLFVWITIPFLEIIPSSKALIIGVYSVLIILYNIWVYVGIFKGNLWWKIFKASLAVGLAYFFQVPVNYFVYSVLRPFIDWVDAIF